MFLGAPIASGVAECDEGAVADLLCDLMHYCDATKQDFDTQLTRALGHYAAETEED